MSKQKVLAAARKKHGKQVWIDECPGALKPAEREAVYAKLTDLRNQLKYTDNEATTQKIKESWLAFIMAARFACDVDGDDPSLPQLNDVTIRAEQLHDLLLERDALRVEIRKLERKAPHARRFRVCKTFADGLFAHVVAEGDTLAELLEKLQ